MEQYQAAREFIKCDPEPYKKVFSHAEDVSNANPFGPVVRGWTDVAATLDRAAAPWKDGEVIGFETVVKYATPDLCLHRGGGELQGEDGWECGTLAGGLADDEHPST